LTTVYAFLSRVSILTRNIDIANMSVCLSVCPSVTFRYQMKTVYHIVIVFSPYGVFISIKHLHEIPTGSPPSGSQNTGAV